MLSVKSEVIKRLIGNPRCPKCNAELEWLKNYSSGENYYCVQLDGDNLRYEEEEFQPDNKVNDYEYPQCSEVLFTDEDKVLKFLRGEISGK